ncbi:hypothetical protein ACROYT_G040691 [Oculina patagonica]
MLVTGVILVALGVIIGLLLPNKAQKTVEDNACVDSKDSPGYKRWEGPAHFTTKAYIWNITNKEGFLYRGEKPKLVERGPYVYSIESKKVDVKFETGKVTSKSFEQAKFNKTLTEKECPTCREDDKLTVLNAAYLGLMAEAGSAENFGLAFIPLVLNLIFQGLSTVTSHAKESDVKSSSTFYTCESTVGDRFTYAAVNGQSEVMKALYPNASPKQLKVRGYYVQFPGAKSLKACSTKYTPLAKSYELFISTFLLAVPITYKEDVEVHDIPMHKYVLDKSALEVNNVTVFTRGIFDVTRVMKGPIYASLPGFLHGDPSLYKELDLNAPETEKYESFLSVEPISGTAMHLKLRIQLNGKILDSSLSPSYPGTKNVTFLNKQIPISWTETEAIIDPETAKEYSSQLFGGLRLSCGLLVALPVIGGILVILGVVFIVLAVKKSDSVTAA